jgi:predicted GIY-YIG superfamily endonuclease
MWSVYVLKSLKDLILYVGMSKDVEQRLRHHNAGKSKFTSGHKPWQLIYVENNFQSATDARLREKYFKSAAGKKFLQKKIETMSMESQGSLPA